VMSRPDDIHDRRTSPTKEQHHAEAC
jgi:hypothetical protein